MARPRQLTDRRGLDGVALRRHERTGSAGRRLCPSLQPAGCGDPAGHRNLASALMRYLALPGVRHSLERECLVEQQHLDHL
jgi:hypothetical protein